MITKPFFLDPWYEGTLDSSAFRQRFSDLHVTKIPWSWLLGMSLLGVLIAVFGLIVQLWQFLLAAGVFGAMLVIVLCIGLLDAVIYRSRRAQMDRLAWEGELVFGRLVSCMRKAEGDQDDYILEVHFEATTPTGKKISGTQSRLRDDLFNSPLPTPGTPVAVLVLDEMTHALL